MVEHFSAISIWWRLRLTLCCPCVASPALHGWALAWGRCVTKERQSMPPYLPWPREIISLSRFTVSSHAQTLSLSLSVFTLPSSFPTLSPSFLPPSFSLSLLPTYFPGNRYVLISRALPNQLYRRISGVRFITILEQLALCSSLTSSSDILTLHSHPIVAHSPSLWPPSLTFPSHAGAIYLFLFLSILSLYTNPIIFHSSPHSFLPVVLLIHLT